ncbi:MAG TPA: 8-oxoguanine deaminase [Conexibacter sp.]|nr:8-oxoguanine deaminase [Conexibacter sp.]
MSPSAEVRTVIEGCAVATVDAAGTEYADGHVVLRGSRIEAVGEGPAPAAGDGVPERRVDARGCLVTPALVNAHHHLFQWTTRGLAQEANLPGWLGALYPIWALVDEEGERIAARAGLAALLRSGCGTTTDHHYIFPRDGGDLLAAEIEVAQELGVRFHPCRGSIDRGRSQGGWPPDHVVEDRDTILAASEAAIDRWHDPSPDAMLQIALGPCSPHSLTRELVVESIALARRRGVRLHTHLAVTREEEAHCLAQYGCRPVDYASRLGLIGDDVWFAHGVHLDEDERRLLAQTGTGVAHCPSSNGRLGDGIAPVAGLLRVGAPVGLGVDGAASNEDAELRTEMRLALLYARLRDGAAALSARQALALGTIGGARCLGRGAELGSLEPGKLADVAVWRVDETGQAGIDDPVWTLVFGPRPQVRLLLVNGRAVVEDGELRTAAEDQIAADAVRASRQLRARAAELASHDVGQSSHP